MSTQSSRRLLEIHVVSAHDLPPVSKMLRTFAVAYVDPDNKLTTKIDHQGHTNPKWNYKVAFHVDDEFLKNESSAVTIEIYNLAWLRDLPIGTARLAINTLSPPLAKNPGFRRVSVRVCRPSGHLQGTLNLGVQLVDVNVAPGREIRSPSSVEKDEEVYEDDHDQETNEHEHEHVKEEMIMYDPTEAAQASASPSQSLASSSRITTTRPESEAETKTATTSAAGSFYSVMRPLPSEVASDLKRGLYSAEWNEYGSEIFDNWTEVGDRSSEGMRAESEQWPIVENEVPALTTEKELLTGCVHRQKKKKTGLFSCFGNAYGLEFSFICGSKRLKKRKPKSRNVDKHSIHLMSLPDKYEYPRGY